MKKNESIRQATRATIVCPVPNATTVIIIVTIGEATVSKLLFIIVFIIITI